MTDTGITQLRIDVAKRGKWNIGYFGSGFLFWIFVTVTANLFSLETSRYYWLAGTFFIFPVAVILSKIFKADPFTKGNALGELVGYTHMSIITLTFPIVIVTMIYYPEALILVMAISYCLDFYVMTWAFGSPLFGIHAAARMIIVTIIYFALPEWRLTILPATVAFAYLLTIVLIPIVKKRWFLNHSQEEINRTKLQVESSTNAGEFAK